jgi:DNA-binding PadR family transcriptional regulator
MGCFMSEPADPQNNLPMTETTFFILLSLAPGPSHGYAIMKDVQQLSQTRVVLSTGTLYGALKRLLELHWIERTDDPAEGENGRERKSYRLTQLGQVALDGEIERLNGLLSAAGQRVVGKPNVLQYNPPSG